MTLPEKYKAFVLKDYNATSESFLVSEKPITEPKEGQVLVKIHSSPINPSDLMFVRGLYGIKKKLPAPGGFEASGTIVAVGPNSEYKIGDRVACVSTGNDGTWAEYVLTAGENCLPLLDEVGLEEGSMLFVNPLTCYAMVNEVIKNGSPAFVQTAAASALGKMTVRLAKIKGIPLINIVRKKEQEEILQKEGAEYILNSSSPNFDKEFFRMTKKLGANFLIDSVGGELTTKLFTILPNKSRIIVYGNLSEKNFEIIPGLLIFQDKKIEGFWLTYWLANIKRTELLEHSKDLQKLLPTCFKSEVNKRFSVEQGFEALEYYKNHMTEGKVIIQP